MASTKNPDGRRVFNDEYSFPQDTQDLANDIYDSWNARVGTSAERQSFPVEQRKPGMTWTETDTGSIYRAADNAGRDWLLVIEPELRPTSVNGGTVDTFGGIVPLAGASTVRVNGVFSSRFRVYRVQFWLAMSVSTAGLGVNLTKGGVSHSAAQYAAQRMIVNGGSVTASSSSGQAGWSGTGITGSNLQGEWLFRNPATSGIKSFDADASQAPGLGFSQERGWLGNVESETFDGFQFTASSGTFQGGFLKVQPQG